MQISKKVTKGGGTTIPRMLHQETGILPGVPVDATADATGIHIVKHVLAYRFCGVVEDVVTVCRMEVCQTCVGEIAEVLQ